MMRKYGSGTTPNPFKTDHNYRFEKLEIGIGPDGQSIFADGHNDASSDEGKGTSRSKSKFKESGAN